MTRAQQRAIKEFWPDFGVDVPSGVLDLGLLFPDPGPVILDIGFGDGEALLDLARNHPNIHYLGVEVYEPGIGHLLLGLDAAQISNVRVIHSDAAELLSQHLPAAAIAAINLFFPDPWPKKRHFKRRLLQPEFADDLCRALQPGGLFHFATDWLPYAEHARNILGTASQLRPLDVSEVVGSPLAQRPPTKFERRGVALGHPVTDLYYRKP